MPSRWEKIRIFTTKRSCKYVGRISKFRVGLLSPVDRFQLLLVGLVFLMIVIVLLFIWMFAQFHQLFSFQRSFVRRRRTIFAARFTNSHGITVDGRATAWCTFLLLSILFYFIQPSIETLKEAGKIPLFQEQLLIYF